MLHHPREQTPAEIGVETPIDPEAIEDGTTRIDFHKHPERPHRLATFQPQPFAHEPGLRRIGPCDTEPQLQACEDVQVVQWEASKEGRSAFAEEAAVNRENAEGVGGIEDVVGFAAETFGDEEIIEARSRSAVVVRMEVDG